MKNKKTTSPKTGKKASGRRVFYGDQSRRMTSITRKLNIRLVRRKLGIYLFSDILLFLLSSVAFLAGLEYSTLSGFESLKDTSRWFSTDRSARQIWYTIADGDGTTLLSKNVTLFFIILSCIILSLLGLQLLGLLFGYFSENRRIRRILSPINEIALKADELSRLSFSEDKYQLLENAIDHIQPGESTTLSFQDSDLTGVEAAMNNLLTRMRDTYRQQARFVNDASHELRTPIAVIQGYANMLDRWGKTDEKILEESISAIKNEAEHMNYLVEQLLFLARGDSGKMVLKTEPVQTDLFMREIYEESLMIDEQHLYRLVTGGQCAEVTIDPGLMKQAVRILIDNAAKYTPTGEEILLSYGLDEKNLPYLQVQDTGSGIEESELPHIFERFYRADEARESAGTGLGLSIAKWIVDKHNGHFEVLSRKGLGTRIRIVLT